MRRSIHTLSLALIALLSACAAPTATTPSKEEPPRATAVSQAPVTYIVPNDADFAVQPGPVNRLVFVGYQGGEPTKREIVRFNFSSDTGFLERRTDNGTAGSGKRYTIKKSATVEDQRVVVNFTAIEYVTYQQGLIGKFAVPSYTDEDASKFLKSAYLYVKFEVDSEYNPESTYANFVRLMKARTVRAGERDPVSGKIFKQEFGTNLRGRELSITVETFPYRNGSKALVYARIPGVETAPNEIDFAVLIREVRERLSQIVKA